LVKRIAAQPFAPFSPALLLSAPAVTRLMVKINPIPGAAFLRRLHLVLAATLTALSTALVAARWLQPEENLAFGGFRFFVAIPVASAFLLLGAALFLTEFGYRRLLPFAWLASAIGLAGLAENFAGRSLGLAVLGTDDFSARAGTAAHMSPLLCLSLILGGGLLAMLASDRWLKHATVPLAIAGSLFMAIGGSTLLARSVGLSSVGNWSPQSALTPTAAALLLLFGTALLNLAWREHQKGMPGAPAWLPLPVIIASATFTVVFWIGLRDREALYASANTQSAINNLASAIRYEMEHQLIVMDRAARRWGQDASFPQELWNVDAGLLSEEIGGCVAITWTDSAFRTQRVQPLAGNESLLSFDQRSVRERREALALATSSNSSVASASHDLPIDGRGYAIFCPVVRSNASAGFAGCEVLYQRFFSALDRRTKLSGNFQYRLSVASDVVFRTPAFSEDTSASRLESVFDIFDRRVRIEMQPSLENLRRSRRPLPEMALLAGLGITALLGLSVHLARKARTGLREARLSNQRLSAENEERRRIEEMLKISDERLRLALDSTQMGIFEWSLTSNHLYYSSGIWAMLGYLPGVIPPTPEAWTALIHPEDLPAYRQLVEAQLRGDTPFIDPEYRVRTAEGDWRWVYARCRTVSRSAGGAPLRIIGTIQDISARKRSEQALRESQASARKLSLVASKTDNLVLIARPEGTIEWVNESFERVMEFPLSEIDGKNPATFMIGPETNPRTVRRIKVALKRGTGISTDIVNYSKSGKKFHLQIDIQPVRNEAGVLENFIAVMADISARVETEQNLRRAKAEADAASRAKSEFLASMSHEIRTPMNGVIGMTSLLLDTKMSHEQRDYVTTIRNSGDALLTIINDILDFSKIESGKLELEHLPFDLSVCIEEALDLFALAAAQKGVELNYHIDDAVPSWIVGDVTRLRQVLVNLVNNAVKFTPQGHIAVSVSRIGELDTTPSRPGPVDIEIAVSDTGIGIPADRMSRLFRPFSQVDSSTTRKYGGTGLGLAICHRLCSLMGEGIRVKSTVNKGSTFTFSIKSQSMPTPPGWGLPEMPVQLNYGPILCLEDNPVCQSRLETFFRSWGGKAVSAASLEAASDYIKDDNKPSALVLDYDLVRPKTAASFLARIADLEIPTLFLLPNAQTPTTEIPRQQRFSTVAKPLRTLSLVRGIQSIFNALPASSPPFAFSPAGQRLLAHEIPLDILLVEDNPVNQKVALRFLQRLGYRADAVGNGLEAVNTLDARRYDLVLMDLQMPELDGFEACRQIRKRVPLEQQPRIVALTANALSGDRELCLAAGMNDYIAKPVKIHEIADAIRRQFSGSRPPFRMQKKEGEASS
jgi:PAS domain S-box-containing protein